MKHADGARFEITVKSSYREIIAGLREFSMEGYEWYTQQQTNWENRSLEAPVIFMEGIGEPNEACLLGGTHVANMARLIKWDDLWSDKYIYI